MLFNALHPWVGPAFFPYSLPTAGVAMMYPMMTTMINNDHHNDYDVI